MTSTARRFWTACGAVSCSPLVQAFALVGSERTAADSVQRLVRTEDGERLTRKQAMAVVRQLRSAGVQP